MTSYPLHVMNDMLPGYMKETVKASEKQSMDEIHEALNKLENSTDIIVDTKAISYVCRLISTHMSLKYCFEISTKAYAAKVLYQVFSKPSANIQTKNKILSTIMNLLGKTYEHVPFEFSWIAVWKESLDLVLREKKYESIAGDEVMMSYIFKLIEFLTAMRKLYIGRDEVTIKEIMKESTKKLSDLRSSASVEGVLLLITCLPTISIDYDEYLPNWIEIWTSVEHNTVWDVCWLTLLTRARKNSKKFDWSVLSGTLMSKVRQFLGINTTRAENFSQFPRAFPRYYYFFLGRQFDEKKTGLRKLAKLLYFTTMTPHIGTTSMKLVKGDPITITPVEISSYGSSGNQKLIPGYNTTGEVLPQAVELCLFLQSLRPFFYPSNTGNWTSHLATFVSSLIDEVSSHVGYSLASKIMIGKETTVLYDSLKVFKDPIHVPTLQYIIGSSLSLIMESLYGKSPAMLQSASACVKNIIVMDPSYVDVFLPLFLSALDSTAVTQSHQALAALQTLVLCFKHFLYPRPVILDYLPQLLRLSLPGIDPSDQTKTVISLKFFSTVFSWVPIRSHYESILVDQTSFIDLVNTKRNENDEINSSNNNSNKMMTVDKAHQVQLDSLASLWSEWIPMFWDRIVLLLNISEERNKGNKQQVNMMAGSIAECVSNVYRALRTGCNLSTSSPEEVYFRQLFEDRVLEYATKSSAYYSAKTLSKILRSLCSANPSTLSKVFQSLVDNEVQSLNCSNEKLAFRLYLVGGACRNATGDSLLQHLDTVILPLIKNDKFLQHGDKDVKKAYIKLVKNVLRGLTATFIINIPSAYEINIPDISSDGTIGYIFGSPNPMGSGVIEWYVPSNEALLKAIDILKIVVTYPMEQIRMILTNLSSSGLSSIDNSNSNDSSNGSNVDSSPQTFKKVEEALTMYLKLIQKSLRGAAEILGDDTLPPSALHAEEVVEGFVDINADSDTSMDQGNMEESLTSVTSIISARDKLISILENESDRQYLLSLRREVLELLLFIDKTLSSFEATTRMITSGSNTDSVSSIITSTPMYTEPDGVLVSINPASFIGLTNSTSIMKSWFKLFQILVINRMSHLKDIDTVKKGMEYAISMSTSAIVKSVQKYIKHHFPEVEEHLSLEQSNIMAIQSMNTIEYWFGHDLPTTYIAQNATVNYINHIQAYAIQSIRKLSKSTLQGKLFHKALYALLRATGHEYDNIRHEAVSAFDRVSYRFGSRLNGIIDDIFWGINNGTFPTKSNKRSSISIIEKDTLKEVSYSILAGYFSILRQNRILSRIIGSSDLVIKYLDIVITVPSIIAKVADPEKRSRLDRHYMDSFGKYINIWIHLASLDSVFVEKQQKLVILCLEKLQGSNISSGDSSLKHDAVLAYIILHFIGKKDFEVPKVVWNWTIDTISSAHGQPVQLVAISSLIRCAYIKYILPNNLLIQSIPDFTTTIHWPKFLHGISLTHPREVDGHNSWTNSILESAFNISCLMSRRVYCDVIEDTRSSQPKFQKRYSALFLSLFSNIEINDPTTIPTIITTALAAATNLSSTNEIEERANNATKSELFCGIYQAYHTKVLSGSITFILWKQIEQVLVDFMVENTQNISMSHAYDWTDAIYFTYFQTPIEWKYMTTRNMSNNNSNTISSTSQSNVASATANTTSITTTTTTSTSEGEGFAKHQKALLFLRSILSADITAGIASDANIVTTEAATRGSVIAQMIYDILCDKSSTNLLSPFYYIRLEVATILGCLTCFIPSCQTIDMTVIANRLIESSTANNSSLSTNTSNGTVPETIIVGDMEESSKIANAVSKYSSEVAMFWLKNYIHYLTVDQQQPMIVKSVTEIISKLLRLVIEASGHPDLEYAKTAHNTVLQTAVYLSLSYRPNAKGDILNGDLIGLVLQTYGSYTTHESWHVRETVSMAMNIYMTANWSILSSAEKKYCKDKIVELQFDMKPEVQNISIVGMISYLTNKSASEVATLAAAYTKNLDTLAARETKKRKLLKDSDTNTSNTNSNQESILLLTPTSDKSHWGTIAMAISLIRTFPYDLPPFLPTLVTSLIKHLNFLKEKSFITKAIQDFKRSHQDKWTQFSASFTREQLDDLQGTGAAHYFA